MSSSNNQAPSILSNVLKVSGQIRSEGDIQIDGEIYGDTISSAATIGEHGIIHGIIAADTVTIRGRVDGSIYGRQVHLCATAQISGDIFHTILAVEQGAHFNGRAHCVDDPLSEQSMPQLTLPDTDADNDTPHLKSV